jgi:hypothetical protein
VRRTRRANFEDEVVTSPAPGGGMTTETTRPGTQTFVAFEVALIDRELGLIWGLTH